MIGEVGIVDTDEGDRGRREVPGAIHGQEIGEIIVPSSQWLDAGLIQESQTREEGEEHELCTGAKHENVGAQLEVFSTRLQHK
jgi:hypothetical protein